MEKDKQVVRPIENTLILCLRATQTEPYLAMCHKALKKSAERNSNCVEACSACIIRVFIIQCAVTQIYVSVKIWKRKQLV